MYLLTRVPGAVCTTLAEKDERFLSFSDAVLNALRCGHGGRKECHPTCCGESALRPVGSPAAGWGAELRARTRSGLPHLLALRPQVTEPVLPARTPASANGDTRRSRGTPRPV